MVYKKIVLVINKCLLYFISFLYFCHLAEGSTLLGVCQLHRTPLNPGIFSWEVLEIMGDFCHIPLYNNIINKYNAELQIPEQKSQANSVPGELVSCLLS